MDHLPEPWKKSPLLVTGTLPAPVPGSREFDPGAPAGSELNEYYILIAHLPHETQGILESILSQGARADQVIIYWKGESAFRHPQLALLGCLDEIRAESPEDFRNRLLARVEAQRQVQLASALSTAAASLAELAGEERQARTDSARIAHALACCYALAPGAHARALGICLRESGPPSSIWGSETAPERIIAEAAQFSLACLKNGTGLREALRERASSLSFRARTELTQHAESCLGAVLGVRHVA